MFHLKPMATGNFYDIYNSVYKTDYQRPEMEAIGPKENPMTPTFKWSPNIAMPLVKSHFPTSYPYKPSPLASVQKLREEVLIQDDIDTCNTTKTRDYDAEFDSHGDRRLAQVPFVSNKEFYNPPYTRNTFERASYFDEMKKLKPILKPVSQRPSTLPSRGMMPMMYPDGTNNTAASTRKDTSYYEDFSAKKCSTCLPPNEKRVTGSRRALYEPQRTDDYMPVPMQPLNTLSIF